MPVYTDLIPDLAAEVLETGLKTDGGVCGTIGGRKPRGGIWTRLPLGDPCFVRSRDDKGENFLEFATASISVPGDAKWQSARAGIIGAGFA